MVVTAPLLRLPEIRRLNAQFIHLVLAGMFFAAVFAGRRAAAQQPAVEERSPSQSAAARGPRQHSQQARTIIEQFRPFLRGIAVYVTYVPKVREERPNLELFGPDIVIRGEPQQFHIIEPQCRKIFDWLVDDGYFDRAKEVLSYKGRQGQPVGPCYDLTVSVGAQVPMYHASIGWDVDTIVRLRALQGQLDGPSAKHVDSMIRAVAKDLAGEPVPPLAMSRGPVAADGRPPISLTVAAEKTHYEVGDLIVLDFTIENRSNKDLSIYDGTDLFQSWFHELEFVDLAGKPIAFATPDQDLSQATVVSQRLRAGEKTTHKVLLNGWQLAGLGHPYTAIGKELRKFTVIGTYRTPAGLDVKVPEAWLGRASAKPIEISIEPQSEQPRPMSVSQLPERLAAVVKQRFPKGEIMRAEKPPYKPLDEGGSMGLTVRDGKKEIHVEVNCANQCYQINRISREVAPAELPEFVMEAVQSKHPHAVVKSAQEAQNGLMGWAHKTPKPADFYLRITTANHEELDIWLTPVFRRDAKGNSEPDPSKVRIESESPMTTAEGHTQI